MAIFIFYPSSFPFCANFNESLLKSLLKLCSWKQEKIFLSYYFQKSIVLGRCKIQNAVKENTTPQVAHRCNNLDWFFFFQCILARDTRTWSIRIAWYSVISDFSETLNKYIYSCYPSRLFCNMNYFWLEVWVLKSLLRWEIHMPRVMKHSILINN